MKFGRWFCGVALLLGAGCGVDLIVGGTPEASTGAVGATGGAGGSTAADPPAEDSSTSAGGTSSGGSAMDTTTGGPEPEASTGGSTTSPVAEGSTTGQDIVCEELGFGDCSELRQCLWDGVPEEGICLANPCIDPMDECLELPFADCVETPLCAWVGEPKVGECGNFFCVPCEVLDEGQCSELLSCDWIGAKEICVEV